MVRNVQGAPVHFWSRKQENTIFLVFCRKFQQAAMFFITWLWFSWWTNSVRYRMLTVRCCYIVQQGVLYSGGEFPGLKMTVLANFWAFLSVLKRHYPLHIGLLSPQICTEHRGVKNPWKIGRNPPIGGKEYTLYSVKIELRARSRWVVQYSIRVQTLSCHWQS